MKALLLTCLLLSPFLFAHEGGHGPIIGARGPGGGKLSAVIRAAQAERGRKAEGVMLAETRTRGRDVSVSLLTNEKKRETGVNDPAAKLILVFAGDSKPSVSANAI